MMKLLTWNTHSLQEENSQQKLEWAVEGILKEMPDIIALQEVNQTASAELAEGFLQEGRYLFPTKVPLRQDNYGAQVVRCLRQAGVPCYWAWLPIKLGYGQFDEGIALLSLGRKITAAEAVPISITDAYDNWRTRAVLGIQVEGLEDWFYSVHMGWWDDREEPFLQQWETLNGYLEKRRRNGTVWLMGDFNAPDIFLNQSYTCIRTAGWFDTHREAAKKESDFTVSGRIDGWRDRLPDENVKGLRLDYIFCSTKKEILSSRILFDGKNGPVVSDHFGLLIEGREDGK